MKVLLIGSEGQVGQELKRVLIEPLRVVGLSRQQLDLSNLDQIYPTVVEHRPDWVINAAAYTAVDQAEREPELASQINAQAPAILAKAAAACNAAMVHLSTDYVFDGAQGRPYIETDSPCPMNCYGKSKLAGEVAVQQANPHHLIVRTAWVYGSHGKSNFVKTMLRLGAEREIIKVVSDQIGAPTWAKDIALTVAHMINLPVSKTAGIYHYTNSGVISWYDFAIAIFAEAIHLGLLTKAPEVIPITTADYPTLARRPANSALSCTKITELLGHYPPYWRESLRKMLSELV
ncbi:MAG: dTDP-4-dehydrorhamnose reductase [Leptolyngbyaceae cyanobacterium MO_188.B28]|nr:dTDP-4-dehydrorhamnose reductase [Leptolyngbyaceae cyanobacterium MO_188.B28]